MAYYYSLKTKKEEHCLEQRIGGDFDYAVYDLKQNLLKPKVIVKKEAVVEFIWNKQQELKSVFKKLDSEPAPEKEKTLEEKIEEKIKEGEKKGWKSDYKEEEEILTENTHTRRTKVLLEGGLRNPVMTKDNEYVIVARLDFDTNDVSIEVHSKPSDDMLVSTKQYKQIVDHLFLALVTSFPDFVENHICQSVHRQTGMDYQEVVEGYREQATMRVKAYKAIMKIIGESLEIYKKQVNLP